MSPELCLVDPELAAAARLALAQAAESPRPGQRPRPPRWLVVSLALGAWLLVVHPQSLSNSGGSAPLERPVAERPPTGPASPQAATPQAAIPQSTPPAAFAAARRAAASRPAGHVAARRPVRTAVARRTLSWPSVATARFYDVILWRGGARVLDLWPTAARVTLPRQWSFHGKRFTLADGPYQWFVYPATGTRAAARYGPLARRGTVAPGRAS